MSNHTLDAKLVVRIDTDIERALLEYRRGQLDVPGQSEAVRRILRAHLRQWLNYPSIAEGA